MSEPADNSINEFYRRLPEMIDALSDPTEKRDRHRKTASKVFGVEPSQVSDEQRRAARSINFKLMYGMSSGRVLGFYPDKGVE